ncbi:MAG TPA: hypothetical protein VGD17_07780 [Chitinophagaceae bacterium]
MNEKEFYIGWMPVAPASFSKLVKRVVIALGILVIFIAVFLALLQRKFSNAVFEFGTLTQVSGIYYESPYPAIKVISSSDVFGRNSYITIPLVGYGKSGASGIIREKENAVGSSLGGKNVTLRGTLLYSDGKTLMQIDKNEEPFVSIGDPAPPGKLPVKEALGFVTVRGEIVDPKCYFGVMKPGEGKPHKDCAIRCILGGIPPVMRVVSGGGQTNYYLLAADSPGNIGEAVKNIIAEPVELTARAVRQDDWVILYLKDAGDIKRISGRMLVMPDVTPVLCSVK